MNTDTRILIEKARKGDIDAFSELFEAMRPMAFAVACRLVGPTDADDVVMEAYLKAWKAIPRFRGHSALRTWTYRIVNNCALDLIRSRKRIREAPLAGSTPGDSPVPDVADHDQPAPDETLALADDARRVRTALKELSEPYRDALLLRYTDGLSYAEIAAATGISIGTVMSRLFNAKRKLKIVIEKQDKH